MSEKKIRIEKIFRTVLNYQGQLGGSTSQENVESWDSLSHINLIFALEEEFDIEIDENEMVNMLSFEDIIKVMGKK